MERRKYIASGLAFVLALGAGAGMVSSSSASSAAAGADTKKCVTRAEMTKIRPGMSKKAVVRILDGPGKRVGPAVRVYKTCNPVVPFEVGYTRAFGSKKQSKVRVRYTDTTYTPPGAPKPPVSPPAPPVSPPAPPVSPPVTPPVKQVPVEPDLDFISSTENTLTVAWFLQAANGTLDRYQFGWWTEFGEPGVWSSPELDVKDPAVVNPFVYQGLDPDTVYKVWMRVRNENGWSLRRWLTMQTAPKPAGLQGTVTLDQVDDKFVGELFTMSGSMTSSDATVPKDVVIQQKMAQGEWAEVAHKHGLLGDGKFTIDKQIAAPQTPGTAQYRALMYYEGSLLFASSEVMSFQVNDSGPVDPPVDPPVYTDPLVRPPTGVQERWVDGAASCQTLTVNVAHQLRENPWEWDEDAERWVEVWGPWTTHHNTVRQATVKDCVNLVQDVPADALLPDIRIKQLNRCGAGDLAATNGTCFKIVNPAPYVPDFPKLNGRKLLKFPVLTMNAGDGPAEVIADRSGATEKDWKAYQTFYRPGGVRESVVAPNVKFYFAGDGHNHWHFTDFDDYWIETLDGVRVRSAEKHGYCLLDNTTLTSMKGAPGVPGVPVYVEASTCGEGLPDALTILQGLSKGWGDTYPTSLPDQALDVTGLADGRYRIGVTADAVGAVTEMSETNNTATIEVTITGDVVTVHPETATGGVT